LDAKGISGSDFFFLKLRLIFGNFIEMPFLPELFLLFVGVLKRDLIAFPARRSLAIDSLSDCLRRGSFGIAGLYSGFILILIKYYVLLHANVEVLNTTTTSKNNQQPKALAHQNNFKPINHVILKDVDGSIVT